MSRSSGDRRAKRKLESLREQLKQVQQRLAGAKRQMDDPREVAELERKQAAIEAEIAHWKEQE
ncbi:MAG: hypothetical protein GYA33_09885 [Thermogutta sp.]|nr:hypothetical protein [Thermogutta sp.]